MAVDRQRQVEDLYHAALERPAADRASFVANRSLGDDELRRGVEAMLAKQNATEMRPSPVGIPVGTMIGTFRIDGVLAEGGMGVVCAATDTALNRRVAVKFLSEDLLDANARRRFQREAQMASALNHPHIVTVYAAGEHEGRQYLVTEYVDGGTLHDWMGRRAPWLEAERRAADRRRRCTRDCARRQHPASRHQAREHPRQPKRLREAR